MPLPPQQATILRIIDGDTVLVQRRGGLLRSGPEDRIRMWGIDAPESAQEGGPQSTKYLTKIMRQGSTVWLTQMDTDHYGRTVAVLHRDRNNPANSYNRQMVQGGHARCYMLSGPHRALYQAAEEEARAARRGLWQRRKQEEPSQYRRRQRRKARRASRIKLYLALGAAAAAAALIGYLYLTSGPGFPP